MAVGNRAVQGKNINDQLAFRKGGLANLRLLDGVQSNSLQPPSLVLFFNSQPVTVQFRRKALRMSQDLKIKDAAIYARTNSERFVIIDLTG